MKLKNITLFLLIAAFGISSCKKDEEPGTGSTSLPEGNYVKVGSTTLLENQWSSSSNTPEAGNQFVYNINFNSAKTHRFTLQFDGQPVVDKTYGMAQTPDASNVSIYYKTESNEGYVPNGDGSAVLTVKDGKKYLEVHGTLINPSNSKTISIDARMEWFL